MSSPWFMESSRAQMRTDRPPQYYKLSEANTTPTSKARSQNGFPEDNRSFQNCMDPLHHPRYEDFVPYRPYRQDATTIERQNHHVEPVPQQPSTSPLPSRQWLTLPQPLPFGAFRASNPHIVDLEPPSVQRTQSFGPSFRTSAPASRNAAPRPKRRPRPLDQERLRQPVDSTMLYPQLSPYDDGIDDGFGNATFDYYPRSVSQPVTPGLPQSGSQESTAPTLTFPTYTPEFTPARGDNSDAAFNDEHEFRLFVEATAGLGPDLSLDHGESSSEPPENHAQDTRIGPQPAVSPIEDTPSTFRALQHRSTPPQLPSHHQRPQLQRFGSDFDSWLQAPPSQPRLTQHLSMPHISNLGPLTHWEDVPDVSPIEDELPDYASSQAQAQAAQRIEATRRAQELQRRWQESGSHTVRFAHGR
jgi:hypothetical protein